MPRVRLIHWKAEEAAPMIEVLRSAGHAVEHQEKFPSSALTVIRQSPPEAVVIDLSRIPSHGREIAVAMRASKTLRHIPILFVDGAPEKVETVRALLPDAAYTTRGRLGAALKRALANPPVAPVVPKQMMDRFGSRTAAQKLGIVENSVAAVVDPPRDYARAIGDLPAGASLEEDARDAAITIWFVTETEVFLEMLPQMRTRAARSKLWILWQKQSKRKTSEINETLIRETALACGLVDYKVCSVTETWSGLLFALKKGDS